MDLHYSSPASTSSCLPKIIYKLRSSSPTSTVVKFVTVLTIATTIVITRIHSHADNDTAVTSSKAEWSQSALPWIFETQSSNRTSGYSDTGSTHHPSRHNSLENNHDWKLLFVGNSYTEFNDLASLTQQLLEEQLMKLYQKNEHPTLRNQKEQQHYTVTTRSHHPGGEVFYGHYNTTREDFEPPASYYYVDETTTELRDWLVTHPEPWHWVIFQEQSQVPGFWDVAVDRDHSFNVSVESIIKLNHLVEGLPPTEQIIQKNDTATTATTTIPAQTMFYMTWGRRNGDERNPYLYRDYSTMQARLTKGYQQYQEVTSRTGQRPTFMAPVGLVFQTIFEQCRQEKSYAMTSADNPGADPDSLFYQLYFEDGSHPSIIGSYAAALTMYASITGEDPRNIRWMPWGVKAPVALIIREAVAKTILATASSDGSDPLYPKISYPWQQQQVEEKKDEVDDQPSFPVSEEQDPVDTVDMSETSNSTADDDVSIDVAVPQQQQQQVNSADEKTKDNDDNTEALP